VVEGTFNSRSVTRIVRVTARQIQYWDEIGLVKPSAGAAAGRGTRRLYSFIDLVRLSVVRTLIERGLSPGKIRRGLAALRQFTPELMDPLAELKLVTDGERLFLVTADRRKILDVLDRQFAFSLALGPLVRELAGRARRVRGPSEEHSREAASTARGRREQVRGRATTAGAAPGVVVRGPSEEHSREAASTARGRREQVRGTARA
jgi:DNA-binding transcriptional MerR regulator